MTISKKENLVFIKFIGKFLNFLETHDKHLPIVAHDSINPH